MLFLASKRVASQVWTCWEKSRPCRTLKHVWDCLNFFYGDVTRDPWSVKSVYCCDEGLDNAEYLYWWIFRCKIFLMLVLAILSPATRLQFSGFLMLKKEFLLRNPDTQTAMTLNSTTCYLQFTSVNNILVFTIQITKKKKKYN